MRKSSTLMPHNTLAKSLLFILPIFILFNCQDCANSGYVYGPDTIINMEKTPCFGACPAFTVEINGVGEATYNGVRFVDKEGSHTKVFSPEECNKVFEAFADADYWTYQDEYTGNVTDLPTTFLQFKHEGNDKRIRMYYNVPEELRSLEALVDTLANSGGWTEVSN